MKKIRKHILSLSFVLLIIEIILLLSGKIELAYYNFFLLLVFILTYFLSSRFELHAGYFIGFIFVALLNAFGGLVSIDNIRLYDYYFGFFKLDILIHATALFFTTLLIFDILQAALFSRNKKFLIYVSALSAIGFGALFEILEFLGIILLKNGGVGDYYNNAIDLVSNLLGTIAASILLILKINNGKRP